MTEMPENEEAGISTINNTEANENVSTDLSPENPLLSIVNELRKQYPETPVENLIQQGLIRLTSSGIITSEAERFRIETLRALGIPAEERDYGQMEVDHSTKQEELAEIMGE